MSCIQSHKDKAVTQLPSVIHEIIDDNVVEKFITFLPTEQHEIIRKLIRAPKAFVCTGGIQRFINYLVTSKFDLYLFNIATCEKAQPEILHYIAIATDYFDGDLVTNVVTAPPTLEMIAKRSIVVPFLRLLVMHKNATLSVFMTVVNNPVVSLEALCTIVQRCLTSPYLQNITVTRRSSQQTTQDQLSDQCKMIITIITTILRKQVINEELLNDIAAKIEENTVLRTIAEHPNAKFTTFNIIIENSASDDFTLALVVHRWFTELLSSKRPSQERSAKSLLLQVRLHPHAGKATWDATTIHDQHALSIEQFSDYAVDKRLAAITARTVLPEIIHDIITHPRVSYKTPLTITAIIKNPYTAQEDLVDVVDMVHDLRLFHDIVMHPHHNTFSDKQLLTSEAFRFFPDYDKKILIERVSQGVTMSAAAVAAAAGVAAGAAVGEAGDVVTVGRDDEASVEAPVIQGEEKQEQEQLSSPFKPVSRL